MIVDHQLKQVFIHIPKCAGSTIRRAIERNGPVVSFTNDVREIDGNQIDFTHLPYKHWDRYLPNLYKDTKDYEFVAIIRDPATRFRSSFSQLRKKLEKKNRILTNDQLIEFFSNKVEHIRKNQLDASFIHFQPQVLFLDDVPNVKYLCMENTLGLQKYFLENWNVAIDFSIRQNSAQLLRYRSLIKLVRLTGISNAKIFGENLKSKIRRSLYSRQETFDAQKLIERFDGFYYNFYEADISLYRSLSE